MSFTREDVWRYSLNPREFATGVYAIAARVSSYRGDGAVTFDLEWHYTSRDTGHECVERIAQGPRYSFLTSMDDDTLNVLLSALPQAGQAIPSMLWSIFWITQVKQGAMDEWLLPALGKATPMPDEADLLPRFHRVERAKAAINFLTSLRKDHT